MRLPGERAPARNWSAPWPGSVPALLGDQGEAGGTLCPPSTADQGALQKPHTEQTPRKATRLSAQSIPHGARLLKATLVAGCQLHSPSNCQTKPLRECLSPKKP